MKIQYSLILLMTVVLAVFFASCSDLHKSLPTPTTTEVQIHPSGWAVETSADFHGAAIQANQWDMRPCQRCHGADYAGGTAQVSCYACHPNPGGPENCGTCHGVPPPPAVRGDTIGTGAHAMHLYGPGSYSAYTVSCQSCHTVPTSVYGANHPNTGANAGVIVTDPVGLTRSNGVTPNISYDPATGRCSNAYCHGNWTLPKSGLPSDSVFSGTVITGANYSPRWNGGPSEKACGTCHALPPTGHKTYSQSCSTCHESVTSAAGKAMHINGKINLAGGVVRNFR